MKRVCALFVSLAALLIFAGCGDSPRDVAAKWYSAAVLDGDSNKANDFSTEDSRKANGVLSGVISITITGDGDSVKIEKDKEQVEQFKAKLEELKKAEEKINGDTAELFVKEKKVLELKIVNGEWKVDVPKYMRSLGVRPSLYN